MKKKEVKLGDVIKVPDIFREHLKNTLEEIQANEMTISTLSVRIRENKKGLWTFINQILPVTKDYTCSYNSEDNSVKIVSKDSE